MTINEFIHGLDDGSTYAEYDERGNVYIYDNTYDALMAQLGASSSVWEVEDDAFTMSPSLLRLMAELADTLPAERELPRYVILNSRIRQQHWEYLKIGDDNQYLILRSTSDPETLIMGSYTIEELEDQKKWLPVKWRSAIDSMLTPLDVALEMGKENKRGPIADNDRRIEVKKG